MPRERYSPEEQEFYRAYINSTAWRQRRAARIAQAGHRCEWVTLVSVVPENRVRCERTRYLCVHHNTYERLGAERDSDLDVFCWFHHMLEHLLWKKCATCGAPALEDEIVAAKWLRIVLGSMGIDLDTGPVNWSCLPAKEILLDQVDPDCVFCSTYQGD